MSYSFIVRADDKDSARIAVAAELDKVVATDPAHEADRSAAEAAFDALLDLAESPEPHENIQVSINAYTMRLLEEAAPSSISVSVTINILDKTA